MTREEMLNKLHNINPGVELVALSSEYALERTFVSSKGCAYDWVSFDEPWPAVKITDLTNDQLDLIKNKLSNKSLSKADLKGSQLLAMFEANESDIDICDAFIGLQNIILGDENALFVLLDDSAVTPQFNFYSDYTLFSNAFEDIFMCVDTEWEELGDEDLMSWIDRLESEFSDIPFCEYTTDNIEGEVND